VGPTYRSGVPRGDVVLAIREMWRGGLRRRVVGARLRGRVDRWAGARGS